MEVLKTPESICWNITHYCNEKCKFCYRDKISQDLSLEENMKILDNMLQSGVKKITFAGGEPLLYPGILELIQYAHDRGAITSLTTNGILVTDELLEKCEGILDWFTLSLDGPDPETQTKMTRHKGHYDNVVRILSTINEKKLSIKVKVNTIVSNINKEDVIRMVPFMKAYGIDRWKLFQFVPLRGDACVNQEAFEISDLEYKKVWEEVQQLLKQYNIQEIASTSSREVIENSYFVVFPNGDVRLSDHLSDTYIGNLLKDRVNEIWQMNQFNIELHTERTKRAISIARGAEYEQSVS